MVTVLTGRYRVGAVIGRGGMGEVRDGFDEALDRPVAIKLMRDDVAGDPDLRRRFEREAQAAARVSQPNVVAIFDVGEHERVPFIVMERLSGRTLADEMAEGPLTRDRVRAIAGEMLDALDAAHRLGVIHRDVKPGNVLLRDDGHVAIGDFGIATIADDAHHTTTGLLFGTAQYLAPERLLGTPATPASDLYSVGIVMFEALTGRPAFRPGAPLAVASAIASDVPRFTESERAGPDPQLLATVDRAIAKDPCDRFPSAAAMHAALDGTTTSDAAPTVPVRGAGDAPGAVGPVAPTERLPVETRPVEAMPVEAMPVGAAPREARPRRRRRVALVVLAAVAIVTGVVVAATTRSDAPGPPAPTTTSVPSDAGAIPAPLRSAIDRLDQAADR